MTHYGSGAADRTILKEEVYEKETKLEPDHEHAYGGSDAGTDTGYGTGSGDAAGNRR